MSCTYVVICYSNVYARAQAGHWNAMCGKIIYKYSLSVLN